VTREALAKATQFTKADQISTNEIVFTIPKEKYVYVKAAMDNSTNSVYVTFDKIGNLERAESDIFRGKLHNV
jgi:mannose-1-phosphate guanylyltransferase